MSLAVARAVAVTDVTEVALASIQGACYLLAVRMALPDGTNVERTLGEVMIIWAPARPLVGWACWGEVVQMRTMRCALTDIRPLYAKQCDARQQIIRQLVTLWPTLAYTLQPA